MNTQSYPWISRQTTNDIYQELIAKPTGLRIFLIQAPAGLGKTFLGRDIGTRLGSETGYERSHKDDIYWSGIVDLYDPDTSNSRRIEQRWIDAFASVTRLEFHEYSRQRGFYEESKKEGKPRSELEKQIQAIRSGFADGMEKVVEKIYPVMAFDTVERLQSILDPAQQELNIQAIDPPDVLEWLFFQMQRLPRGLILMLGRTVAGQADEIQRRIDDKISEERRKRGLEPILFKVLPLQYLGENESEEFFGLRKAIFPDLEELLDPNLKSLLVEYTGGNPLLLDIAIQTLLETRDVERMKTDLATTKGIDMVEEALLTAYMHFGASERQGLLTYLAIARNGLFLNLLEHLEAKNACQLYQELEQMVNLPFVKVRDIFVADPSQEDRGAQRTYFLHDEMYAICDRVGLIRPEQTRDDSGKILAWYDEQIEKHQKNATARGYSDAVIDLMVESLPYRMRMDPINGYQWYLEQSNRAITAGERELDSRIRDAMAQFIRSADEKEKTGELPANAIDRQILISTAPNLFEDFKIDSALQWVMRYSVRGKHEKALELVKRTTWVRHGYETNPARYLIVYAEMRLWQGQSTMYMGKPNDALRVYDETLLDVEKMYSPDGVKARIDAKSISAFDATRICFTAGRLHNNRGYIYWIYQGKYRLAIEEFLEAIRYFELIDLKEEIANSKDNIGRVYTILGYSFAASQAISEGLELRRNENQTYREALSRNSLAISYARFENIPQALKEVDSALQIFRRNGIERGIALAQITRGMANRKHGEMKVVDVSIEEAMKYVDEGEADLLEALRIFTNTVQEPIRRVQACNELACCYRARYNLLKSKGSPERIRRALDRGKSYFDLAIEIADDYDFLIEKLDSLQDRAVLYASAQMYDKAREDLESIGSLIPEPYKIVASRGLQHLDPSECTDTFYKIMGQVELLIGTIAYEEELTRCGTGEKPGTETVLEMMEHFVLAVAYFNVFSGEALTYQQTHHRIYSRLRGHNREFLTELRDQHLRRLIEKYDLPVDLIGKEFYEIFGLLIPVNKAQTWEKLARR